LNQTNKTNKQTNINTTQTNKHKHKQRKNTDKDLSVSMRPETEIGVDDLLKKLDKAIKK